VRRTASGSINTSNNAVTTVSVSCNANERLVGGGASITGSTVRSAISQNFPASVGAGGTWTASAISYTSGGASETLTVYATCESP
jgi:hypothetical protein